MKKALFIINPISGSKDKSQFRERILHGIDRSRIEVEVRYTEAQGHATELAREAASKGTEIIVATGGDGSVNEAGAGLIGTDSVLGIIPTGSGNGMARHLKIPVHFEKALKIINGGRTCTIDTMRADGRFCIGTIGLGFDAHVAHLFSKAGKRGYSTYVKLVLAEFRSYRAKDFFILADNVLHERRCFLLTFANSSQFGNNAVIAPFADVKDGLMEISMLKKFPALMAPNLIFRLMNNSIHGSRFFRTMRARNVIVKNTEALKGHIDGEPVTFMSDVKIEMVPLSLNVIVP